MKSTTVLVTVLALIFAFGCGDKGSDKPGPQAPGAVASKLAFGLKAGDTLRYRTATRNVAETPMGNQIQDITQEMTWKVLEVAGDGTATVELTVDAVKAHMENPMTGTTDYDSAAPDAAEKANDPTLATVAGLVGKSFKMKLTPRGKVVAVEGFFELMEAAMKENMMWSMLKDAFSNEAMAGNMQSGWCEFPDKDYELGDTWQSTGKMILPMMGELAIDNSYKIDEIVDGPDGKVVKISFESTLTADSLKPPAAGGLPLTMGGGNIRGTMEFDPGRGCILGSNTNTSMTLEAMGMEIKPTVTQKLELIR